MKSFSFEKYIGQEVRLELDDGREFVGELMDCDAKGVVMRFVEATATPITYFKMSGVKFIDFEYEEQDKPSVSSDAPVRVLKMANA